MEATKRTYQKYKTEKKITIKHYVNTNITEINHYGEEVCPIYFQVIFERKNTNIRSKITPIPKSLSESFSRHDFDKNSIYKEAIERNKFFIEYLFSEYITNNSNQYNFSDLPKLYHYANFDLLNFVEFCLNLEISWNTRLIGGSPIISHILKVNPLSNLQYSIKKYSQLELLKDTYKSEVWFLDLILLQIESTQLNDEIGTPLENYLANQNQFKKLRPTILDFRNGYFETTLIKYFGDQQAVRNIISDIEKLFIKFDNDDYNILYIVKPLL